MRKSVCLLVFLVPFTLATESASAQQPKVYLGAGGGSSSISFNSSDFDLGIPQTADKSSTGFKAFVGVNFNEYIALEIGYVDLGKFKISYNGGIAGTAAFDYKVSGFAVSGVVSIPVAHELSLLARVGAFSSTAKNSLSSASGAIALNLCRGPQGQ